MKHRYYKWKTSGQFKNENKQWIRNGQRHFIFYSRKIKRWLWSGESGSGKSVTSLAVMGLLPKGQSQIALQSKIFEGKTYWIYPQKNAEKVW